jgi:hypothetical protein
VNVYEAFIEEVRALRIPADTQAVAVVDQLTRACKRAQMVADGELSTVADRARVKLRDE